MRLGANAQFARVERAALVEGVEHEQTVVDRQADQEMTREGHALQRQADAAGEIKFQDRECDRVAGAALDHFVEVAVARVVVVLLVAGIALFLEQQAMQGAQGV